MDKLLYQHLPMLSADSLDIHSSIPLCIQTPTLEGGQEVYICTHQLSFVLEMRADFRTATTPLLDTINVVATAGILELCAKVTVMCTDI